MISTRIRKVHLNLSMVSRTNCKPLWTIQEIHQGYGQVKTIISCFIHDQNRFCNRSKLFLYLSRWRFLTATKKIEIIENVFIFYRFQFLMCRLFQKSIKVVNMNGSLIVSSSNRPIWIDNLMIYWFWPRKAVCSRHLRATIVDDIDFSFYETSTWLDIPYFTARRR